MATTKNLAKLVMAVRSFSIFNPASEMFKYGYALVTRTFSITSMVLVLLLCSCSEDLGGLDNTGVMSTKPVEPELPTVKVTVDSIRQEAIVDFTYNGKVQSFTVKAQLTPEKEHIIEAENLPISSFKASSTDTVGTSYSRIYTYPYGNGDDLVYRNVLKTSADKLSVELAAGVTVGVKFGSMSHNSVKESDNKKLSKPRSEEYESSYQTAYSGSASWSTFGAKENKSFGIPAIATNYRNIMNGKGQADIQEHIDRRLIPDQDLENVTVWLTDNGEAYGDTVHLKLHYGLTVEKPNLGSYDVTSADDYTMTTTATGNWGEWKSTSDSRVKRQEMAAAGIMWDKDGDNPQIATLWTLFREMASVVINGIKIDVLAADYNIISDVCNKPEKASASDKAGSDLYNATDKLVTKYSLSETEYDELSGSEKAKLYVKQSDAKVKSVQWSEVGYEHTTNALKLAASSKAVREDGSKGKSETSNQTWSESFKCTSSWTTNAANAMTAIEGTGEIQKVGDASFIKDTTVVDGNFKWTGKQFKQKLQQNVTVEIGNNQLNTWEHTYWQNVKVEYLGFAYSGDELNIDAPTYSCGTPSVVKGEEGLTSTEYSYAEEGRAAFKDVTRKATANGKINVAKTEEYLKDWKVEENIFTFRVLGVDGKLVILKTYSTGKQTRTTATYNFVGDIKMTNVTSNEVAPGETLDVSATETIESTVPKMLKREAGDYYQFDLQTVSYKLGTYRPSYNGAKEQYKVELTRARNIVYVDPTDNIRIEIANPTGSYSAAAASEFAKVSEEINANGDTAQVWKRNMNFTIKVADDVQTYSPEGIENITRAYQKPAKKLTGIEVVNKTNSNNGLYHAVGADLYKVYDDGSKELVTTLSKGWDGSSRAVGVTTTENAVSESLGGVNRTLYSSNAKQDGKFSYNENTYLCTVSGSRNSGSYDYQWFITTAEDIKYADNIEGYDVNVSWDNFSQSATSSASDFAMTSETPVSGGKNQIWSRAHNLLYTINGQQVTIANTGVINTFVKDEEPEVTPEINANITSILNTVCRTSDHNGTAHTLLLKLDNGNCIVVGKDGGKSVVWGNEVADHGYNGGVFVYQGSAQMAGQLLPAKIEYENDEVLLYSTYFNGSWAPVDRFEFLAAQGSGWNASGNVWEDKTGEFSYSTEQLNGAVKVTIGNESHTFKGISARTRGSRRW